MSHTTTTISSSPKAINTGDVNYVLAAGSHDVKTLCIHKNINPAAVFRPRFMGGMVHVATSDFQSRLSQLAAPSSGVSGVTMKCVNYGIWVPYFNSSANGYPWYAGHIKWNPRPADSTQFGDITQFDGYNHNAKFKNPVLTVECAKGSKLKVTFLDNSTGESITAKTLFGSNENAYFGFFVYEYTGDGPVLSGSGAVTPKLYISNYYVAQTGQMRVVPSDFNVVADKKYDIVPIVAVDNGGDYEYYSLHISDNVPGIITKYSSSTDIEFVYFRYAETGAGDAYYPDGDAMESGSPISGVTAAVFSFALKMTSPFGKILADSDTSYSSGLIRPGTIKITASFRRLSDGKVFTKDYTASSGLNVAHQISDTLRMYILHSTIMSWAQSTAGTVAGYFDFKISFTINVNTSGSSEKNTFPAVSWMTGEIQRD